MFERFTDKARRVVVQSQEEARRLNHNYIGTEHILLGLLSVPDTVAIAALDDLSISLQQTRTTVESIIGVGQSEPEGHLPFTPRAKKVLELSLREAQRLQHDHIGPEHILLGLVREGEGVAAQVLDRATGRPDAVASRVIELLGGYAAVAPDVGVRTEEVGSPPRPVGVEAGLMLRLAELAAQKQRHRVVEPDDILIALLSARFPQVDALFARLGADVELMRRRVDEILGDASPSPDPPQGQEPEQPA